jgi:hypothetical protein
LESIRLILKDDAVLVELAKTRFGGLPAVPEGAEFSKPMDFGGGDAYVFRCTCKGGSAKLGWQC